MQSSLVSKYSVANERNSRDPVDRGGIMTSNFKSRSDRDEQNSMRGAANSGSQQDSGSDRGTVRGLFEQMAEGLSRAMSRSSTVSTVEDVEVASNRTTTRGNFSDVIN